MKKTNPKIQSTRRLSDYLKERERKLEFFFLTMFALYLRVGIGHTVKLRFTR